MRASCWLLASCLALSLFAQTSTAADWPMWRKDAQRSAVTGEQLPDGLQRLWSRQLAPAEPAWPEDPRLEFDVDYQPIVQGSLLFLASNVNDSVTAYDTTSGEQKWRFFAGGPVRFAPVARGGKLYFGADDGYLYCVNAVDGKLLWQLRVAPSDRLVLANDRLASVWPVRGGPVLSGDRLCLTTGVWPFEGSFLYELDLKQTADAVPTLADFKVTALPDLGPQGYLAVNSQRLYIPCGRATASCYDLAKDDFVSLSYGGRTDFHITGNGRWLLHGETVYDAQQQKSLSLNAPRSLVQGDWLFAPQGEVIAAYDVAHPVIVEVKDKRGKVSKKATYPPAWKFAESALNKVAPVEPGKDGKLPPLHIDLIAGDRLYGHRENTVFAFAIPAPPENPADEETKPEGKSKSDDETKPAEKPKPTMVTDVAWFAQVDSPVSGAIAADGKLFVTTRDGWLHCFAADAKEPQTYERTKRFYQRPVPQVAEWLKQSRAASGYALVLGTASAEELAGLATQSALRVIAVDQETTRVNDARRKLDSLGLYGKRLAVLHGDPQSINLPPYLANLIVLRDADPSDALIEHAYRSLRPYGGTLLMAANDTQHARIAALAKKLPRADVEHNSGWTLLRRAGALQGAANWTHEYGDPANTLMSHDDLVRAPLGLLWYGGPAGDGSIFYDRHLWGPSLAVIDGRMFIQGNDRLTGLDIYTGQVLWQEQLKHGLSPGRQAAWDSTGFHFVAEHDAIYLAYPDVCLKLDPTTGKQSGEFKLPEEGDQWGRIRVWKNQLITAVFHKNDNGELLAQKLVALDRQNGKVLWTQQSEQGFPLVAVGGNRVFCYEGLLPDLFENRKRKGLTPKTNEIGFIKCYDADTGKELWSRSISRIATWMAYSEEQDVLVASNKQGMDGWRGKDGEELWSKTAEGEGFRGHPENLWDKVILRGDQIIDQRGPGMAYSLKTGEPIRWTHPITGEPVNWEFTKTGHHCNYAIANDHLMTFRAATAGFCDLDSAGTGRLVGFRSGCRNSLIPAGGILNAPNFASGCVCNYSVFTSLALMHVPDAELWTYSSLQPPQGEVRHVGVNFAAPGDRMAADGTLWLDYPSRNQPDYKYPAVAGPSPDLKVKVTGKELRWIYRHAAQVQGDGLRWVAASGVEGADRIVIPLGKDKQPHPYRVTLYFAEPSATAAGQRVFDVSVAGQQVLKDFDIFATAGGADRIVVKKIDTLEAAGELQIELKSIAGRTFLSGVEIDQRGYE